MVKEKFSSFKNIIFVDGRSDVEVIFRLIKLLRAKGNQREDYLKNQIDKFGYSFLNRR